MEATPSRLMQSVQRLSKAVDFAAVRRDGRSWADRLVVLIACPNRLEVSRAGFAVGKRIGKAVVRNKIKRRLREAARLSGVGGGWDLVLIARKDASSADFHSLNRSVTSLSRRAGILSKPPQGLSRLPKTR